MMIAVNKMLLPVALVALIASTNLMAENTPAAQTESEEDQIGLEQGLDRDRAAHRAEILEQKRKEEEAKRKGAGLDRERARQRAEHMDEKRE